MPKLSPINNISQVLDMGINSYKHIESTQINSYGTSDRMNFVRNYPINDYQIGGETDEQKQPVKYIMGVIDFGNKKYRVTN